MYCILPAEIPVKYKENFRQHLTIFIYPNYRQQQWMTSG